MFDAFLRMSVSEVTCWFLAILLIPTVIYLIIYGEGGVVQCRNARRSMATINKK